jgi:hypothetical protein
MVVGDEEKAFAQVQVFLKNVSSPDRLTIPTISVHSALLPTTATVVEVVIVVVPRRMEQISPTVIFSLSSVALQ